MNERIKELAEQAGLLARTIDPTVETRHMKKKEQDLAKFAELIAAEEREACAKVCDAHVGIWIVPAGPQECAAAIRARGNDA